MWKSIDSKKPILNSQQVLHLPPSPVKRVQSHPLVFIRRWQWGWHEGRKKQKARPLNCNVSFRLKSSDTLLDSLINRYDLAGSRRYPPSVEADEKTSRREEGREKERKERKKEQGNDKPAPACKRHWCDLRQISSRRPVIQGKRRGEIVIR